MTAIGMKSLVLLVGALAAGFLGEAFSGENIRSHNNFIFWQSLGCAPAIVLYCLFGFSEWLLAAVITIVLACALSFRLRRPRKLYLLFQLPITLTGFLITLSAANLSVPAAWLGWLSGGAASLILLAAAFVIARLFNADQWEDLSNCIVYADVKNVFLACMTALTTLPAAGALALCPVPLGASAAVGLLILLAELALLSAALCGAFMTLDSARRHVKLLLARQNQQDLYQFMSVIRSQRHDYGMHIHTIHGLIAAGQYDKCREYVSALVADTQDVSIMMLVKDPIIGALISGYRDMAMERGCDFIISIADNMEHVVATPYDINRVIGNLLQNALDAVSGDQCTDKSIVFSTIRRSGYCVIRVTNQIQDPESVARVFDYGYTTKNAHEGIGLNSVSRILANYKGAIYYELHGDRIDFVAKIPNNI